MTLESEAGKRLRSLPGEEHATARDDSLLGMLALGRAFLSIPQLAQGLQEQQRLAAAGQPRRLGQILLALGHLTPAQFLDLLSQQGRGLRVCVPCGRVHDRDLLGDTEPPPCPGCGALLPPIEREWAGPPAGAAANTVETLGSVVPSPTISGGGDLLAGHGQFGRYLLQSPLARGGMGQVWRAWDPQLGRVIALKHVFAESANSPEVCARFLREARLAARLRHPNIVPIFDVGVEGGLPYLTMECLEGRTLAERLEERREPKRKGDAAGFDGLRAEVLLLAEVAEAVAYAHREGVIHRDLKPGNVLVDGDERPHILDFGLAKELEPTTSGRGTVSVSAETVADPSARENRGSPLTHTGELLGTPGHMSPEQVEGDLHAVGPTTDVWALGAMLYEVLTGETPFPVDGTMRMLWAILHSDPVPPRRRNAHAPPDLEAVALRALEKPPARRYATAAEFAAELRRWLEGVPVRAVRHGPARRAWRWLVRRRTVALSVAGACVLAVAALALQRQTEGRSESRARALLAKVSGSVDRFENHVRSLALSPAARAALAQQPLELLDALVADDPAFGPAWSWRGRVKLLLGREREGESDLDEGCTRSPEHAVVWFQRGLHRLEQYAAARGEPDLVSGPGGIEFLPSRDESADERAAREGGLRDLARAEAVASTDPLAGKADLALARALAAWPADLDLRVVQGQSREAAALAGESVGVDPRPILRQAIEDYYMVLAQVPGHSMAMCRRALALIALGHAEDARGGPADEVLQRALEACDRALQAGPDVDRVRVNRAIATMLLGDRAARRGEDPRPLYGRAIADAARPWRPGATWWKATPTALRRPGGSHGRRP